MQSWQPGEALPLNTSSPLLIGSRSPDLSYRGSLHADAYSSSSTSSSSVNMIMSMFHTYQSSIDEKLGTVIDDLAEMRSVLQRLESQQSALESGLHSSSMSSTTSTPKSLSHHKRTHVTPTALQVCDFY